MSHLSVAKFGGTSVANYSAMQACAKIIIAVAVIAGILAAVAIISILAQTPMPI